MFQEQKCTVLFIVVLNSIAFGHIDKEPSVIKIKKDTGEDIYFPLDQGPTNDGGYYEKHIGHCETDGQKIVGCKCEPGLVLFGYLDPRWVFVCGKRCTDGSLCPTPPKGHAECIYTFCGLTCSSNSDCIDGAVCTKRRDREGPVCLYRT
ncbi:hypothetical protein FOL47_006957 [Perkinsus chesapeaki]|uniref:Uncharacterized protein n=1 Tax=Perkinsus chesapeaki TaxID=330153 RepID=A0A7J6N273_PERCH|nr:hypothetical protein FOL47_006957 [Perkinsus chesapeaki]